MTRHLDRCRTGHDLLAELRHTPGVTLLRQTGSHAILRLPDGTEEVIPDHRQELGKGLRCKILKHLAAAGIAVALLVAAAIVWSLL